MTDTKNVLWLDSVFQMGDVELNKFIECLMQLRAYMVDHGTPEGFCYGATTKVNWWDGKKTPFICWAKSGCRIWRLSVVNGVAQGFTQSIPATKEDRLKAAGDPMDVYEVWRPGGYPPDWFVVYKTSTYWLVCLASETTEKL